jgi:hypothetical protein
MNKAFVRTDDEADADDGLDLDLPAAPTGQRNYVTPQG